MKNSNQRWLALSHQSHSGHNLSLGMFHKCFHLLNRADTLVCPMGDRHRPWAADQPWYLTRNQSPVEIRRVIVVELAECGSTLGTRPQGAPTSAESRRRIDFAGFYNKFFLTREKCRLRHRAHAVQRAAHDL